jgi:hypothetical protein
MKRIWKVFTQWQQLEFDKSENIGMEEDVSKNGTK